MRFYLDEGISPAVGMPLRGVFVGHEFTDTTSEHLTETKDLPLFAEMRARRMDVFVTLDRRQLRNPAEVVAIRESGCHWFGLAQPSTKGVTAFARQGASLLVALAYFLEEPPTEPTAYVVKAAGRQVGQVFSRNVAISQL